MMRAYGALASSRTEAGIPWTVVDRYAERYGIEGDDFERFATWVRMMDQASQRVA